MKNKLKSLLIRIRTRLHTERYYARFWRQYAMWWRKPTVFLFGVPFHSNLGDQAQTFCILQWIEKHLPKHQVCITMLTTFTERRLRIIRRVFRKGDILLCHSGYHMTDLYKEKDVYEAVARMFPDTPVRILPQTIHFKKEENAKSCAQVFNHHGHSTLLCRDELSYKMAQSLFSACKLHLYPDIVTSLIGRFPVPAPEKRDGVLFCMRNDKEAFYSKEHIAHLRAEIEKHYHTDLSDTTVDIPTEHIAAHRQEVLADTFAEMARYRVVITDRYHGTIFSLIANTPVIVVNSADHKLSSGVRWFPESFSRHVFFAASTAEVPDLVDKIMNQAPPAPLPPYFDEKYYGKNLAHALDLTDYV